MMMRTDSKPRKIVVLGVTILLVSAIAGCDLVPSSRITFGEARYELREDKEGRLIRLDKVTGEIVLVQEAIRQSNRTTRTQPSPPQAPRLSAPVSAPQVVEPPQPPITSEGLAAPQELASIATLDLCGHTQIPDMGVTLADAPVFVAPQALPTPLATLVSGVIVQITEQADDWLLVRFEDPRFGPRAGYVRCSNLRRLTATNTPGS
jgi:hypothetical protein